MKTFITLLAVAGANANIFADFAAPTDFVPGAYDFEGMSPMPTAAPALVKRQAQSDSICGYLEGDPAYPLDCGAGHPCGFNTAYNWFGCCASEVGSGSAAVPTGCPVATSCLPYASLSACTGACASDTLLKKCTNSATPYCGVITVSGHTSVADYLCLTTSLPPVELQLTASASGSSPTTTAGGSGGNGGGIGVGGGSGSSSGSGSSISSGAFVNPSAAKSTSSTTSSTSSSTAATTTAASASKAAAAQTGVPMGVAGVAGMVAAMGLL
ncbi:hypothetical protein BT63DRAFT_456705 [Microthyrium microscopicum]|uniref:Secreted protein n=1 Tax=Microthyrium microscopicum TaxID=703497 RepID=A0A6A6U552_9PEZI|nr:hypothetical protein BT63DRAFT_456705 [Microthyrium microscopicum]